MKYNIDSIIDDGEYKGKTVGDVLTENKKNILSLIKSGYDFSEDVLEKAGIKKQIRNVSVDGMTLFKKDPVKLMEYEKPKQKNKTKKCLDDVEINNPSEILDEIIEFELRGSLIDDINLSDYDKIDE